MDRQELERCLAVAAGRKPADLVIKGAELLNVFTDHWVSGDIAICGEYIAGVGDYDGLEEIDLTGKYIVPGFIDTHMHLESTMVTPPQTAAEVVPWGTTTLIADPHELANVSGLDGIRYILEQTEGLPCTVFVMLPSCVPATDFEDSGAVLDADALLTLADHPRVLGLAEVMDYPGVISGSPAVLDKLMAFSSKIKDGHAPSLSGKTLQAYRAAGIKTEHECSTAEEALEKIAAGFYLLAREGSAAKNLKALMQAALEHRLPYGRFAFCTDDKHIEDIRQKGHIRENIHLAIGMGVPPIEAYKMASFYGAQIYGLDDRGAISPGCLADLVVLKDPEAVDIHSVYCGGKLVSHKQSRPHYPPRPAPEHLLNSLHTTALSAEDLRLHCGTAPYPVIELVPNQITTRRRDSLLPNEVGIFMPNARFAKAAVLERHHATGSVGLGVVSGFNLHGALATSVGHDSHNLMVLGDNDGDMLLAVEALVDQGGGYIQVSDGSVIGSLPLPICGLLTDAPIEAVLGTLEQMIKNARKMGVPESCDPFVTLSFLALPVIPELRLTNRGIFDVTTMAFLKSDSTHDL